MLITEETKVPFRKEKGGGGGGGGWEEKKRLSRSYIPSRWSLKF